MTKSAILTSLLRISRLVFGVVFIFSGFVKAIDPLGSTYKFQDYFMAFGMEWLYPMALILAIVMSALEFTIGVTVLLGIKMKWSALGGLIFMLFFTPLTLYIALFEPVTDCGCFGDALVISNWATFYKNILILATILLIFYFRNKVKPLWSENKDWYLAGVVAFLAVMLSVYCLRNLPIIDFRPWKIGNNIWGKMQPVQDEIVEYIFTYRNINTGEKKEFALAELPSADGGWEFVDRKDKVIQPFIPPPIDDFVILDEYGDDWAEKYLGNPDYQFLLIAYDLTHTNSGAFEKRINEFAAKAEADNVSFIVLTASSFENIEAFRHTHQTPYPFFQSNEVKLKTIIRANPGLVLMKDWVVLANWHHRNIPDYETVKRKYFTGN